MNLNWDVDIYGNVIDSEGYFVHKPCGRISDPDIAFISKLIKVAPQLLHLLKEYVITDETSSGWQEGNEPYDILRNDAENLIKQFYLEFNRLKEQSEYIQKYSGVPREKLIALGLIKEDEEDEGTFRFQY